MKTTQYLDAVKKTQQISSDYALAKFLQVKQPTVSQYRNGRGYPEPFVCLKIAEALNLPYLRVIGDVEAEREKDEAKRKKWQAVAKVAAVIAFVVVSVSFSPTETMFLPLYIMSNLGTAILAWFMLRNTPSWTKI